MDSHCSEDAMIHDIEELKAATRWAAPTVRIACAEDRFEVESIALRMFELARISSDEAA
jgi:hypothetical protein